MFLQLLTSEQQTFEQLLFTHRNAHGKTQYFQRLMGARKYLRLLLLALSELASDPSRSKTHPLEPEGIPLDGLIYLVATCDHLRAHALKAVRLLMIQLGMSYHMPFAITMIGTCGRFLTTTKQMRASWCKSYVTMRSTAANSGASIVAYPLAALPKDPLEHESVAAILVPRQTTQTPEKPNERQERPKQTSTGHRGGGVRLTNGKQESRNEGDHGEVVQRVSSSSVSNAEKIC